MISQEQFVYLVKTILGSDNDVRKQSEATMAAFQAQHPNEFVTVLLQLSRNPELSIRQFTTVHLKNTTSTFAGKNYTNVWPNLSAETQNLVKEQLFVLLSEEQNQNVRNHLCDCISEIGGSLFAQEKDEWPQLLPLLWQMFLSPRNEIIESGFRLLSGLFSFGIELFKNNIADLGALFNQGIIHQDNQIKTSAIQAIGQYVVNSEYKNYKQFEDLVPPMIKCTYDVLLVDENNGEECLEVFSELVETEYKFLRKHFDTFFAGVQNIFREKKIPHGVKRIGTESIIQLAEKQPKLFKKDNNVYITSLVEMIFFHMIQISEKVEEQWMRPAEGFNDDIEQDEDLETMRFGMSSIDRLIDCLGEKIMLPILSGVVQQLFQHQDWRYKYSAIMALSQVGEYIEEIPEINPIVEVVMGMLPNENPMIRYAVCHAIGQIADDMKPSFQKHYLNSILPQFIARLTIEDVPRVTSHILACLTNFVEGVSEGIEPYLQQLVVISVQFLQTGISIVKENAISVIAASAEAAKSSFIPYINELMPILFNVLETYTTKEYKQLKGQCIEAITLIASSVKSDAFQPFLDKTVNYLIQIQSGNFEATDPQKSYVLSGWQRLCLVCPALLEPYLPRVLPPLFGLIQVIFDIKPSGETGTSYHTYDDEEAEVAINMLSVFIEELKEKFFPYFDKATELIVPLCQFTTDESIRKASANCLVSLVQNVKATGQQQPLVQGAKYFIKTITEAAEKEFDANVIIDQVDCLKEIVDTVGFQFMTAEELSGLSERVFKLLLESDQRKAENEKLAKEEEVDEDEKEQIDVENQTEEELHVKIAEFIGVLFKTHKEQVQPLCELIFTTVLPKVLDVNLTPKMHQFGIFLIDDIVEHLGYSLAGPKFPEFAKALSLFASSKVTFVRQAAVYGIGIFAQNTPKEAYPQFGAQLSQAIVASLQVPKGQNDTDKQFGHCRDNSIAALGKILKAQPESLGAELPNALQHWLNLLPLNFDKPEARIQHAYLCELVTLHGNQLLAGKQENALHVLKILVEVHGTKKSDQNTDSLIVQALKVFEKLDIVAPNWQTLFGLLSQDLQKKLLEVAKLSN